MSPKLTDLPPEVLGLIKARLDRLECCLLSCSSPVLRSTLQQLSSVPCRPRVVVCCSRSSKLVEVDVLTGEVLAASKRLGGRAPWLSNIAFTQDGQHLLASSYEDGKVGAGLLLLSKRLAPCRTTRAEWLGEATTACAKEADITVIGPPLTCLVGPEGIVVAPETVFVADAEIGSVVGLHLRPCFRPSPEKRTSLWGAPACIPAEDQRSVCSWRSNGTQAVLCPADEMTEQFSTDEQVPIPWGLSLGPDGNLYTSKDSVCIDSHAEYAGHYTQPPSGEAKGSVHQIILEVSDPASSTAVTKMTSRCYSHPHGTLRRPSGLCFDAAGDLLVCDITSKVLKFAGPARADPGLFLECWLDTAACGLAQPWDIASIPLGDPWGERIVLVTHSGTRAGRRAGQGSSERCKDARAPHNVCILDGSTKQLLHRLSHRALREPNSIATDQACRYPGSWSDAGSQPVASG